MWHIKKDIDNIRFERLRILTLHKITHQTMQSFLILVLTLLINLTVFAQEEGKKIFLDGSLKKTREKKARFYMYRKQEGDKYILKVFTKKGKLLLEALNSEKDFRNRNGLFTYYHENGQKRSEGVYKNNKEKGEWKWMYSDGKISEIGYFDDKGNKTGYWKGYYESGALEYEGNYLDNKQEGHWKWYYENGSICADAHFISGQQQQLNYYKEDGSLFAGEKVVFKKASFKGGEEALQKYIAENLKYPKAALEQGIEGKLLLFFYVERDGKIREIIVTNHLGGGCEEEAERVVRSMPEWEPAESYNHKIRMPYILPIEFSLKK